MLIRAASGVFTLKLVPFDPGTFRGVFDLLKLFLYHASMTTKQRFRNKYRLEIREDDHLPMHAHLVGGSVDVLINLQTLVCTGAFPRGLRNEVMAWVVANQDELIEEWKKWHP